MLPIRTVYILLILLSIIFNACAPAAAPAQQPAAAAPAGQAAADEAAAAICVDPSKSAIAVYGDQETEFMEAVSTLLDATDGSDGSGWTSQNPHDLSSTPISSYYEDGVDSGTGGIDQVMLFFHAGHGSPANWNTLGDTATTAGMLLGNCSATNSGHLRYYWQCSCQVFAHGPNMCPHGSDSCYSNPGGWIPSDITMQNVYQRWGPALDPNLRMACGASTNAVCNAAVTDQIWSNVSLSSFDVSDAFIDGISQYNNNVGLCITRGSEKMEGTPFVTDHGFTSAANQAGNTHYHIEYSQPFTITHKYGCDPVVENTESTPACSVPKELPILLVNPDTKSGYITGERKLDLGTELSEEEYFSLAQVYLQKERLAEPQSRYAGPFGTHLRLASIPVDAGENIQQQIVQKNVVLTYKRRIDLKEAPNLDTTTIPDYQDQLIDVLGPGGIIKVQLNNDGTGLNATKIWHEIVGAAGLTPIKAYDQALEEAQSQLNTSDAYELQRWFWGYREEADSNVKQSEMHIFYEFWFVPKEDSMKYPPRVIVIPGEEQ